MRSPDPLLRLEESATEGRGSGVSDTSLWPFRVTAEVESQGLDEVESFGDMLVLTSPTKSLSEILKKQVRMELETSGHCLSIA